MSYKDHQTVTDKTDLLRWKMLGYFVIFLISDIDVFVIVIVISLILEAKISNHLFFVSHSWIFYENMFFHITQLIVYNLFLFANVLPMWWILYMFECLLMSPFNLCTVIGGQNEWDWHLYFNKQRLQCCRHNSCESDTKAVSAFFVSHTY